MRTQSSDLPGATSTNRVSMLTGNSSKGVRASNGFGVALELVGELILVAASELHGLECETACATECMRFVRYSRPICSRDHRGFRRRPQWLPGWAGQPATESQ